MESNWRYRIAEVGWANSNWRLAARRLPYNPANYILVVDQGHPTLYSLWQASSSSLPVHFTFRPKMGLNFPYGEPVEPDQT